MEEELKELEGQEPEEPKEPQEPEAPKEPEEPQEPQEPQEPPGPEPEKKRPRGRPRKAEAPVAKAKAPKPKAVKVQEPEATPVDTISSVGTSVPPNFWRDLLATHQRMKAEARSEKWRGFQIVGRKRKNEHSKKEHRHPQTHTPHDPS